ALSSDNRLMSRTSTSREMTLVAQTFDWTLEDLQQVVRCGLENGFAPAEQRQALRDEVVLPAYRAAALGGEALGGEGLSGEGCSGDALTEETQREETLSEEQP